MDYFSKFLRSNNNPPPSSPVDRSHEFHQSWDAIKETLQHPDERQLAKGIKSTNVPSHLKILVDSLVWESTRTEEGGTGSCLEYLLKNDVLGTLVRLSETDRPSGIQAEVLRAVQNMVVLMDEQFLVHSVIHKAVLRLLRNCAGEDMQEQLDGRKVLGAAGSAVRHPASEYEEDLVNLLCILCSRIRTYRELLMIFFHDKHWYHTEPLFSVDEDEEEEEDGVYEAAQAFEIRGPSPTPSQATIKSRGVPPTSKKPEYEFLLFNYLLRFVHREGDIGDFARAGLIFLIDVATSPGEHQPEDPTSSARPPNSDPIRDAEQALAEYILDGDFSDVLGAGLGAVFSLLPSKLAFHLAAAPMLPCGAGMIIGSSGSEDERQEHKIARERAQALGVEDASEPEFKGRLDHFLKLLEFLQDILRRNMSSETIAPTVAVGTAIGQSIMDAVRTVFFENVLYPSILECSDVDGSSVAIMSYIEVILRTLRGGQLADLLVDFLVNEDNDEIRSKQRSLSVLALSAGKSSQPAINKSRRRKSSAMVLLEMEAPESRKQTEYFTTMGRFTLRDLIMSNLRSSSQVTAEAALHLLHSVLIYHPRVTTERILQVLADPCATSFPYPSLIQPHSNEEFEDDEELFTYPGANNHLEITNSDSPFYQPETTYSTHEREMGLYLSLVSRIDPIHSEDVFSTSYDNYLRDALFSIQNQIAYQLSEDEFDPEPQKKQKQKHRLNANDPVLSIILDLLRKFFSNTPELNIALTGTLAGFAIHPHRSLAGWLTFAPNEFDKPEEKIFQETPIPTSNDDDDRSIDFETDALLANDTSALPAASLNDKTRPVIHAVLHGLVTQLERYRALVDNFDRYLLERRQGLLFSENMTDALTVSLNLIDEPASVMPPLEVPQSPLKAKQTTTNTFVSFLTPRKNKPLKSSIPNTPLTKAAPGETVASPFGCHYRDTEAILVEPFVAPVLSSPWTMTTIPRWSMQDDDLGSTWNEQALEQDMRQDDHPPSEEPAAITLSRLLDNVVILEEMIKELAAIIHARRSLGIDTMRYL